MDSHSLVERLITEARQSPPKAMILIAGLLLAVYMWYPLLTTDSTVSDTSAVVTPTHPRGSANRSSRPADITEESRWYQQYQSFRQTRLMEPRTPVLSNLQPNVSRGPEPTPSPSQDEENSKPKPLSRDLPKREPSRRLPESDPESTPDAVHGNDPLERLKVRAVIYRGLQGSLANLNGCIVKVGDQVWWDFSESDPVPRFEPTTSDLPPDWVAITIVRIRETEVDVRIDQTAYTLPVLQSVAPAPTQ